MNSSRVLIRNRYCYAHPLKIQSVALHGNEHGFCPGLHMSEVERGEGLPASGLSGRGFQEMHAGSLVRGSWLCYPCVPLDACGGGCLG